MYEYVSQCLVLGGGTRLSIAGESSLPSLPSPKVLGNFLLVFLLFCGFLCMLSRLSGLTTLPFPLSVGCLLQLDTNRGRGLDRTTYRDSLSVSDTWDP